MNRIWFDETGIEHRLVTEETALAYLDWYLRNTGIMYMDLATEIVKPQILIPQWAESIKDPILLSHRSYEIMYNEVISKIDKIIKDGK